MSSAHSSADSAALLIPLYSFPTTGEWERVARAKKEFPEMPIVAIINPNNGVGSAYDSIFGKGIDNLICSGVIPIGYVHTDYGHRIPGEIVAEIESFVEWYGITGIFFDEVSNRSGYESYYSKLTNIAKSLGSTLTIGNCGAPADSNYFSSFDNLVIYEGTGVPKAEWLHQVRMSQKRTKISFISYGVFPLDIQAIVQTLQEAMYFYVTDFDYPNAYCSLPSYFEDMVSILSRAKKLPFARDGPEILRKLVGKLDFW